MQISGRIANITNYVDFDYENGKIMLYMYQPLEACEQLKGCESLLGISKNTGSYVYFHLATPMRKFNAFMNRHLNINTRVDWYIENYREGISYTDMNFYFPELGYFFPSIGRAKRDEHTCTFNLNYDEIFSFEINILGKICSISFVTNALSSIDLDHTSAYTETLLNVHFDPTDDLKFLVAVQQVIHNTFAFICNRKNITSAKIILIKSGKDQHEASLTCVTLTCVNRFSETPEDMKTIAETTPHFNLYGTHVQELFKLVAADYQDYQNYNLRKIKKEISGTTVEDNNSERDDVGYISISSLQDSRERRNYINLSQTLSLTAGFEFYVRKYLPDMRQGLDANEEKLKSDIEDLLKKQSGRGKKWLKSIIKNLDKSRGLSLSEKLQKAYDGYKTTAGEWKPLKSILHEFPVESVKELADELNKWRNDLAHENRRYFLSLNTVDAVRFIERINYCIVLRHIGYCDRQIREIIRKTFEAEWQPPEPNMKEIEKSLKERVFKMVRPRYLRQNFLRIKTKKKVRIEYQITHIKPFFKVTRGPSF